MNFFEFAENLKNYNTSKFLNDLEQDLSANEKVIDLQRNQWKEGLDNEGNELGRYSRETEILSNGRKKTGELFNLFDTGDFYKNTHLFDEKKDNDLLLNFDSPNGKNTTKLIEKIGVRIFGLQTKNIDKITEIAQETGNKILINNLKIK